jgi:hypothetical protein
MTAVVQNWDEIVRNELLLGARRPVKDRDPGTRPEDRA